jgi:2,4-dienoyl-CoA reductase-like NADH-dependent reductase (Old Yellow Enzyme family)
MHLFEPISLGGVTLKSRTLVAPIARFVAEPGAVPAMQLAHAALRAAVENRLPGSVRAGQVTSTDFLQ